MQTVVLDFLCYIVVFICLCVVGFYRLFQLVVKLDSKFEFRKKIQWSFEAVKFFMHFKIVFHIISIEIFLANNGLNFGVNHQMDRLFTGNF